MRNTVSAASATWLTIVAWAKIASVSGSFFGADAWRLSVDRSPAHSIWLRWFQRTAVWHPGSLVGPSTDAAPQPPSVRYTGGGSATAGRPSSSYWRWRAASSGSWGHALPPTQCKGSETAHASGEFEHTFTYDYPAPLQFARGTLEPTQAQFSHSAYHKQATGAALEGLGGLDQQCLERVNSLGMLPTWECLEDSIGWLV